MRPLDAGSVNVGFVVAGADEAIERLREVREEIDAVRESARHLRVDLTALARLREEASDA